LDDDESHFGVCHEIAVLFAAGMKKLGDGSWARARRQCGILTNYRLDSAKNK